MNWCLKSLFGLVPLIVVPLVHADEPAHLALRNGDRIVLIGDTLIERDQKYGYFETLLTLRHPEKNLEFRNLGWSGDTVYGDARARFGPRDEGTRHLRDHVLALKPTVILVGYGMAESFDGRNGLPQFVKGLNELLDVLSRTGARIVLLSPIAHEDLGRPLPDPARHNRDLALYVQALAGVARARGFPFVDMFHRFPTAAASAASSLEDAHPLTDDGIHLTAWGSWCVGSAIAAMLSEEKEDDCTIALKADGTVVESRGAKVSQMRASGQGLRFEVTEARLPLPPRPEDYSSPLGVPAQRRVLKVTGLSPGRYALKIDGKTVADADARVWEQMTLKNGPERDQVERLRRTINEKNLLYFHRWRPQNETYLFGFRKHEQGNNAREIPLFDPLVAEKEKEIAGLRVPATHVYELIRESEAAR